MAARTRRIHITAVGSSAARDVNRLSPKGFDGMLALAQQGAGELYKVTGNRDMIYARHTEDTGGRSDDADRAREVTRILADDSVSALVTIRGGAWFTRILDRIDFDVLRGRRTTIYLFGFSEMTTLINIAGQYKKAVALYDMGPGFLFAAGERYAVNRFRELTRAVDIRPEEQAGFATGWALAHYPTAFTGFFRDVASILDGKGSSRLSTGRLLQGRIPPTSRITVVGGTLSVVLPMLASPYAAAIDTKGKWLALEDVNEDVDPIDRMMAALKLAGLFERAEGVILGNFHKGPEELSEKAHRILRHHIPPKRNIPVLALDTLGHIETIAPLPMHRPITLRRLPGRSASPRIRLDMPWKDWARR